MASLVLGAIGGFLFGPIGFMVGSLLGNLLFPQHQQGPRLTDLKLHNSGYGLMVPIEYGAMRLPQIVIWQTDLKEHAHNSGGKGGPSVTTYTYSASWAGYLCEGPIDFVRKIWADGTLIYNADDTSMNTLPCTVYVGDELQLPDPTMEGIQGVGNTPAYRGKAYAVWDDTDLTAYGNRIPNLNYEVIKGTEGPIPWRVSSFNATVPDNGNWSTVYYDQPTDTITIAAFYNHSGTLRLWYEESYYHTDGSSAGTSLNIQVDPLDSLAPTGDSSGGYSQPFAVGRVAEVDGDHKGWYFKNSLVNNLGLTSQLAAVPVVMGSFLYAVASSPTRIQRRPLTGNIPAAAPDKSFTLPALGSGSYTYTSVRLSPGDNGLLYVTIDARGVSSTNVLVYELNADLSISRSWQDGQVPPQWSFPHNFVVYKGMVCAIDGLSAFLGNFYLWRIEQPGVTWPVVGSLPVTRTGAAQHGIIRFQNGLVQTWDGVISLDPKLISDSVVLGDIVKDISEREGLQDAQIDVTQLTDLVDGYAITQQQDGRSGITPLQSAYYFDAVESSGVVKFVKRGGAPSVTIPDNDLAAQAGAGGTPPAKVTSKRVQEVDLPAILHVKYMNAAAAYQTGDQMSQRQVTSSQMSQTIELSINMNDSKGKQIANTLLFNAWKEREQFTFLTSRKYDYLEPTDVVIAGGYELRIMDKSDVASAVIQFQGVAALSNLWTQGPTSSSGLANITPVTPTGNQPTTLIPLDIPLVVDGDAQDAWYAAMCGSVDSTWRGANLYISRDNGSTFTQIAGSGIATIVGSASNILGNFLGGNCFDESNALTVVIGAGGGSLASVPRLGVLNGLNKALVGKEIVQFRDATLTAPNTYSLAGLLRGRRGTEFEMPTHATGDLFVFLPSTSDVALTFSDLGQFRQYKAVTFGQSLAATPTLNFIDNANTLRPYSPVQVYGAPNAGNDIVINWKRRTRIGGAWADFTDVPLSESSELYVLQVWDAAFAVCARVVTGITSPTFTYTSAMQVTDFGSNQQTIYITIGQLGSFGLGTQANATIAGGGGSVTAPLHPVQPYNTLPPPTPPSGGGCSGTVVNNTMPWGIVNSLTSSGFGPGQTWVIKIVVPSNAKQGGGLITGVEFGGPPGPRNSVLSLTPCGAPLIPAMQTINDTSIGFSFYVGPNPDPQWKATFVPGQTYYLSITTTLVSDMLVTLTSKGP